jgi:hypothetical protein
MTFVSFFLPIWCLDDQIGNQSVISRHEARLLKRDIRSSIIAIASRRIDSHEGQVVSLEVGDGTEPQPWILASDAVGELPRLLLRLLQSRRLAAVGSTFGLGHDPVSRGIQPKQIRP